MMDQFVLSDIIAGAYVRHPFIKYTMWESPEMWQGGTGQRLSHHSKHHCACRLFAPGPAETCATQPAARLLGAPLLHVTCRLTGAVVLQMWSPS
jgi:hypothetical protein